MDATFFMENQLLALDEAILKSVDQFGHAQPGQLKESMVYSLNTGGKRIRPMLLLATLKALNADIETGLNTAIALEYIHTYSLIHDDLPAMDNVITAGDVGRAGFNPRWRNPPSAIC